MECVESLIFRQSLLTQQKAQISSRLCKLPEFRAILLRKSMFAYGSVGRDRWAREIRMKATHQEMEIVASGKIDLIRGNLRQHLRETSYFVSLIKTLPNIFDISKRLYFK